MGNESWINKIFSREREPEGDVPVKEVESVPPDQEPTPEAREEMRALIERVSKQNEPSPTEESDKQARLEKSREILKQMVAEARAKEEAETKAKASGGSETTGPYKWEDAPNRGGNNRAANM